MTSIGKRLYEVHFGKVRLATDAEIQDALREAAAAVKEQKFTPFFLWTEWTNVVDAWQLDSCYVGGVGPEK